jgi:hypothetical protein
MAALRILLRGLGLLLMTAAYAAFVVDGTRVIAGGPLAAASLGRVIAALSAAAGTRLSPGALAASGGWLLAPIGDVLQVVPAFAALGIAGILLIYAGRPRRPRRPAL